MHIDPQEHCRAHVVYRTGVADAGGVVVDQELLELFDLLVVKHDLRELTDPGVDAVHDLARLDSLVEKGPATLDTLKGVWVKFDVFAVSCDRYHVFDCEGVTGDDDGHARLLLPSGRNERFPEGSLPPTPQQPRPCGLAVRVRRLCAMSEEKQQWRGGRGRSSSLAFPTRYPGVATFNLLARAYRRRVVRGSNNVENGTLRRTRARFRTSLPGVEQN